MPLIIAFPLLKLPLVVAIADRREPDPIDLPNER
jgi:hypothetical protein